MIFKLCLLKTLSPVQQSEVINQIAILEGELQEFNAWHKEAISNLLIQKVNHGVVILDTTSGEASNTVIAYCLYQQLFETIEIFRIGTHPKFRRQGQAKLLIRHLIEELIRYKNNKVVLTTQAERGYEERILLEVAENNKGAIALYISLGFKIFDKREQYYEQANAKRVDALIMQYTFGAETQTLIVGR